MDRGYLIHRVFDRRICMVDVCNCIEAFISIGRWFRWLLSRALCLRRTGCDFDLTAVFLSRRRCNTAMEDINGRYQDKQRRKGKLIQVGQVLETNVFIAFMVS
jgi:hypothetical protein